MSLFGDIASTIGHTVDSLAATVGVDVGMLETVVNDLDGNGVDMFSVASRLGLSVEGFLSDIVSLMRNDPHQLLLEHLTGPMKPTDNALSSLSQQWAQAAYLHQGTAQAIDTQINALFQDSGSDFYSGPAADTLLKKHQDYQTYFTVLVEHAQTQHIRHATLGGHVNDYLNQAPGKVYSLSTPMAAFGVLSLNTAMFVEPSPPWIDPNFIQGAEDNAQNFQGDADSTLPGFENPWWDILEALAAILYLFVGICILINWIQSIIRSFQSQQKSTMVKKPTPVPVASMADDLARQYGVPLSDVEDIISNNPGLTKDQYALLIQYYKKYGRYPYNVRTVFTGVGQNGQPQVYYITEADMANILSHDDPNLRLLSDAELLALIQKLLQKNPRKTLSNNRKQLVDYYYDLVDDNGYDYTVIIRISTSNPGRIISTYEEW